MGARATLPALLDRVALGASEGAKKGVSLMTLHAAKGTEFGSVFITGVEEGLLPHQRSLDRNADIEEERRLCYVGMTRAMDRLYLSYAHTRLLAGRSSIGHPSRFIGEVTPELITVKVSAKRRARPRLAFASVGDAVAHPRWRNGIVRQVEGSGRDTLVTVEFESGTRRLQLCHAPLTRLDTRSADVPAS
jgi:DNA helicase-2/ATP-dependent DNA helicase PcrA